MLNLEVTDREAHARAVPHATLLRVLELQASSFKLQGPSKMTQFRVRADTAAVLRPCFVFRPLAGKLRTQNNTFLRPALLT
jgi:hypothetical protein